MFGAQAMRLLRTRWQNATLLAQELFAMLQDDIPLTQKAPLTLIMPDGSTAPALTIRNPGFSDPTNNVPLIRMEDGQGNPVASIDKNGDTLDAAGKKKTAAADAGSTGSNIDFEVFACQVVGGSGQIYTCHLYPDGITPLSDGHGVPRDFTVKQLRIAAGATIPFGTWDVCMKRSGQLYMQCPVWL